MTPKSTLNRSIRRLAAMGGAIVLGAALGKFTSLHVAWVALVGFIYGCWVVGRLDG